MSPAIQVSNYIHSMELGAMVQFKHISFNIKKPYPFPGARTITMLAVGVRFLYRNEDSSTEILEISLEN